MGGRRIRRVLSLKLIILVQKFELWKFIFYYFKMTNPEPFYYFSSN